jgi:NAD(P)-dependent dehydrogenase (short-subunit alcohol dehydrogenase family)
MSLKGKTLFITGASRGIGLAIALRAARDGANIAIAAKTETPHPKLEGTIHSAAEAIEQAGGQALPLVVDVRDEAAVTGAIAQTVARFGSLDIVVNNASAISLTPVVQTDMKRFDLMHQINARGTFMVSKYAIAHLERAQNPHILMLSPPLDMAEKWFAAIYWLHDGQVRHEHGRAWARRRVAPQGHRRQRTVAPHHDRDRRDQEPARGRLSDIYEAGQELHRPVPDRRYVPRRRRRHRFRRLPRRSEPAAIAGFLRAGLK